jgi:hypothetical protein
MIDGEPRRVLRALRDPTQWRVLIQGHHECYITWEVYEQNQKQIQEHADRFGEIVRGSVKRGAALLGGLLRCGRCGGRMHPAYGRASKRSARYTCQGSAGRHPGAKCQSFGGWKLQEAIERELMRVLEPGAIEAALVGEKSERDAGRRGQRALELELEAARFDAQRAHRQYDAVDPENRVVARELERRWNAALEKLGELEHRWEKLHEEEVQRGDICSEEEMLKVASEFRTVWTDSATDTALKKRIVRCLIQGIIAVRNDEDRTIHAVIHWTGGIHTELIVPLWRPGESRRRTSRDASEIIKELAEVLPDEKIARVLGLLGHKTATELKWTSARIATFRKAHRVPAYNKRQSHETIFDLTRAARYVNVCPMTMHRLLKRGTIKGRQPAPYAPWLINKEDLDQFLERSRREPHREGRSLPSQSKQQTLDFS